MFDTPSFFIDIVLLPHINMNKSLDIIKKNSFFHSTFMEYLKKVVIKAVSFIKFLIFSWYFKRCSLFMTFLYPSKMFHCFINAILITVFCDIICNILYFINGITHRNRKSCHLKHLYIISAISKYNHIFMLPF